MTAIDIGRTEQRLHASVPRKTKPIVVATDGSETSLPAFEVAELIRKRTGCTIRVVSVLEPLPAILPAVEGVVIPPDWEEVREKNQREIVSKQLEPFGSSPEWIVDVILGKPCEAVALYAHEHNAELIIVGSNKHGVIGRFFGEDTAVDIARQSEVPLLVATSAMTSLPKRILVAMDLAPDGMQNTAEVLPLITEDASISCVHVQPRDEFLGVDWAEYDREYQFAVTERFAAVEKTFSNAGFKLDLVSLHGNPAKEVTDFADYSKADLIVVGIKRRVGKSRAIGGRTARRIMQQADCSVLIVPNFAQRKRDMKFANSTRVIADPQMWDSAMREFTRKNAGRLASLEVDDFEMGAMVEARHYPLIGVDYDHRDQCLTIILGDVRGMERHLTRTINKPDTVSILSTDGRDVALSIAHTNGQTLLTF